MLTDDKVRMTVGGWFHGPTIDRPPPYDEPLLSLKLPTFVNVRPAL